jgi:hypothetical protein
MYLVIAVEYAYVMLSAWFEANVVRRRRESIALNKQRYRHGMSPVGDPFDIPWKRPKT